MNAHSSWLRKQKAKLAKYLELRSGQMSQKEAYEKSWPRAEYTSPPRLGKRRDVT